MNLIKGVNLPPLMFGVILILVWFIFHPHYYGGYRMAQLTDAHVSDAELLAAALGELSYILFNSNLFMGLFIVGLVSIALGLTFRNR